MRSFILLLAVLLSSSLPGHAQASDSLRLRAEHLEQQLASLNAKERIESLKWLANYYTHSNADKAIAFYRTAIAETNAGAYQNVNVLHTAQIFCFVIVGQYDSAQVHLHKALALTPEEDPLRSTIFMNAGSLYLRKGDYATALAHYHTAQTIAEKFANENQLMRIYVNTGVVYEMLKDYKMATRFDSLGYHLAIKLKSHASANVALSNLGEHLQLAGFLVAAQTVFKQAEKNALKTPGSQYSLGLIYSNLADIKLKLKKPDSAVHYATKALLLFKEQNSTSHIDGLHRILAKAELKRGNVNKAEHYARLAHTSGVTRKVTTDIAAAAFLLMKINLQKDDVRTAEKFEEEYLSLTDSLENENQAKAVIELQTKYDTEKKESENELLKRDQELQTIQLARQQSITRYIALVLALVMVLLVVGYRSYKLKQKANAQLFQQSENITQQNQLLQETLHDLRTTQQQLIQAEKMASLGKMTAGIAHEINNPLTFIQTGAGEANYLLTQLNKVLTVYEAVDTINVEDQLKKVNQAKAEVNYATLLPALHDNMKAIQLGSHRTSTIIASLRRFSQTGREEFVKKDLAALLDETLLLLQRQLTDKIQVVRDYAASVVLECLPSELGQVITNLVTNAVQAMNHQGTLTLQVKEMHARGVIMVSDTGRGIAPDIITKIFDPFFTTKDVGEGAGLGLAVAHGIVKRHGGEITVRSTVDKGTTFVIMLPLHQPR